MLLFLGISKGFILIIYFWLFSNITAALLVLAGNCRQMQFVACNAMMKQKRRMFKQPNWAQANPNQRMVWIIWPILI